MNLKQYSVRRVTNGPKNHMFGFHDLVQSNAKGDMLLALEIEDISRPPLPGETCSSGVVTLGDSAFREIHKTHTWNYPQGARQQWIGTSDLFTCNDRDAQGKLIARIGDARAGRLVDDLPFPVHCLNAETQQAIWINYDRLQAAGVYGYVPFSGGNARISDLPDDDGLWIGSLKSAEKSLLVSLADVAQCGTRKPVKTGFPHYVTHPMLNPSGTRVAFLHRYRVPDGGETTRLMTIGLDGSNLRCLAKGFLSHFTWTAEDEIFIWGAHQPGLFAMREAPYLRLPGAVQAAKLAKATIRALRRTPQRRSPAARNASAAQLMAFLRIKDSDVLRIEKDALGIIMEDGHPMSRPGELSLVINDSYPNAMGDRQLYFYDLVRHERVEVGRFRRIFKEPDKNAFDWRRTQFGVDPRIIKRVELRHYLFARSGLHCDLHPRWSFDGNTVYFDSIHEGSRQLYAVDYRK